MTLTSYHVVILGKTAELSQRYGLKLSQSKAYLHYDNGFYHLIFPGAPTEEQALDKFDRMMTALGSRSETQEVVASNIDELDLRLDQALRIAPRSRGI